MSAIEAGRGRIDDFDGHLSDEKEIERLTQALPARLSPSWLIEFLTTIPIVGTEFSLDEEDDPSERGVDMRFLAIEQIVDEATACYPGIVAHPLGYLPIGSCLTGSGDYYYLDLRKKSTDPRLVRLPHDGVSGNTYRESEIELVAKRFSDFIRIAQID